MNTENQRYREALEEIKKLGYSGRRWDNIIGLSRRIAKQALEEK